jgi:hypothetical protein
MKLPFVKQRKAAPVLPAIDRPQIGSGWGMFAALRDGLKETLSGLGGNADRVKATKFEPPEEIIQQEVEWAVEFDGVLERFVCGPVEDALAEGIDFEYLSEDEEDFAEQYLSEIGFWPAIEKALVTKRMNHGSLIWIDTGALNNEKPLSPSEAFRPFRLVVLDSDSIYADTYNLHSQPEFWCVGSAEVGNVRRIHKSRVLLFPGRFISDKHRQRKHGWGAREVDKIWEAWISWRLTFLMPPNIAMTFEEGIYAMEGLNQKMTTPAGRELIRNKVFDLESIRGFLRKRIIDATEKFERQGAPVSGLDGIMDRSENFFVAQTGHPRSKLFGGSKGSNLNGDNKGEEGMKLYQSIVRAIQNKDLKPNLQYFFAWIRPALQQRYGLAFENMAFCFESSDTETKGERADRQLKEAQRDAIYLNPANPTIDREELREDLAKRGTYMLDMQPVPEISPEDLGDGEDE